MGHFDITLLIATYNWPRALELCLNSLKNQTDQRFDIVIADDGSKIETRQLIDSFYLKFPIKITHLWQEDQGFRKSKILNSSIHQATGQYLIFLDGDCIVQPDFVEQHRNLAKPNQFITGSRILLSERLTTKLCNSEDEQFFLVDQAPSKILKKIQALRLRLGGDINKVSPLLFKLPDHGLRIFPKYFWKRIKGCNMSCWKQDAIDIKGFDETFEGWGHEDADFVFRLENAGVQRKSGSFSTEVFHLWHKSQPNDKEKINKNKVLSRIANYSK